MSDTGNTCQGCGKPQKQGTLYCTNCGAPVPGAPGGIGGQDTQTVLAPGRATPSGGIPGLGGSAAADQPPTVSVSPAQPVAGPGVQSGQEWRPGQDWNPGADWQQEQQVPWWLAPQQGQQPDGSQQAFGQQGFGPAGTGPQGAVGTSPQVPPGGQRPSRLPMIAVTIAAAALLGAGAGAYVIIARPFSSSSTGATANGANAANVSRATGAPSATSSPATGPASASQPSSSTPTTPPATAPASQPASQGTSEQQAATALNNLLVQSTSDRSAINSAWTDGTNCGGNYTADQQTFQQAASSRQYLLTKLAALPGATTLPAQMLSDLTGAWQASIAVDNDYAQWASDENSSGCTTQDPSYAAANTPNQQATNDKDAFASLWDSVAQQYGLPQYSGDQL